jgi:hypothetical protein
MKIDQLEPGTKVTLLFHGSKSLGNSSYTSEEVFVRMTGTGEDRRAWFTTSDGTYEWEAYRYQGRWAYGSSAERLSLVQ